MKAYDIINLHPLINDYESYLEIGSRPSSECYDFVNIKSKISTGSDSDSFFASNNEEFDVIFINGDRYHDQVLVDIENALKVLKFKGIIVIPDTLFEGPVTEDNSRGTTTWKAVASLRSRKDLFIGTVRAARGVSSIARMSDMRYKTHYLPSRFKPYNKHNLILGTGTDSDSVDESVKNNEERTRTYCETANNDLEKSAWPDEERVHDRWLVNYFEDNIKVLMNTHTEEQYKMINVSCFQLGNLDLTFD